MARTGSGVRLAAGVLALVTAGVVSGTLGDPGPPPPPVATAPASLPRPASRIVSTNLQSDEILLALLPPERLLAVSDFATDPEVSNVAEPARRVPHRVRAFAEPILALDPGLVVMFPFSRPESQALLREAGVPIVHLPSADGVGDVREHVRGLGELVGEPRRAEALVAQMDRRLDEVARRVRGAVRPRVLLYNRSGYTLGAGTPFDELVTIAGGRNAAAAAGMRGNAPLPIARALALDPDAIVVLSYRADARRRDVVPSPSLLEHPAWRTARAVRDGRVIEISPRLLLTTSHHVAATAEALARRLHPERFGVAP